MSERKKKDEIEQVSGVYSTRLTIFEDSPNELIVKCGLSAYPAKVQLTDEIRKFLRRI